MPDHDPLDRFLEHDVKCTEGVEWTSLEGEQFTRRTDAFEGSIRSYWNITMIERMPLTWHRRLILRLWWRPWWTVQDWWWRITHNTDGDDDGD